MKRWWLWAAAFAGAAAIWRPALLQTLGSALLDVILPPLWGGVLALLLAPLYGRLAAAFGGGRLGHTGALAACYALLLGTLAAVFFVLAPQLAHSARLLAADSSQYAANLWQLAEQLQQKLQGSRLPADPDSLQLRRQLTSQLTAWAATVLQRLFPHLLGFTANLVKSALQLFLGLFFSLYLLADGPQLTRQLTAALQTKLPAHRLTRLLEFCALCRRMVSGWLAGQLLDSLILGGCCALGMALLGFAFPLPVGLLMTVCGLVPVVGGTLGGVLGFCLLLAVQPARAGWFLVFYLVLQQLEGRFIYPRIVGGKLGLPPVLVLFAVLCGSELGGFLGILMALPAAAVAWTAFLSKR